MGTAAATCARPVPVADGYWLDDTDCGVDYYHWSDTARAVTAHFTTLSGWGSVVLHGALYTGGAHCDDAGLCTGGFIEKHDTSTGTLLAQHAVGPKESWLPQAAFGSLWTADLDNTTLQRTPRF